LYGAFVWRLKAKNGGSRPGQGGTVEERVVQRAEKKLYRARRGGLAVPLGTFRRESVFCGGLVGRRRRLTTDAVGGLRRAVDQMVNRGSTSNAEKLEKVRKTPSWPRSWANCSL
jgi:hypothetical protein